MATDGWVTLGTTTVGMEMAEVGEFQMEAVKHPMLQTFIVDPQV
jgi:hypothetical protein